MEINAINIIKNPENHTRDVFQGLLGGVCGNPRFARAFFAVFAGRATHTIQFLNSAVHIYLCLLTKL